MWLRAIGTIIMWPWQPRDQGDQAPDASAGDDGLFEKPCWPWQQRSADPLDEEKTVAVQALVAMPSPVLSAAWPTGNCGISPLPSPLASPFSSSVPSVLTSPHSSPRSAPSPPRSAICSEASGSNASGSSDAALSCHDWLEGVKVGYGARFLPAFEQSGVEDAIDVAQIDKRCFEEIERALVHGCGAKPMHVKNVRLALLDLGCELNGTPKQRRTGAGNTASSKAVKRRPPRASAAPSAPVVRKPTPPTAVGSSAQAFQRAPPHAGTDGSFSDAGTDSVHDTPPRSVVGFTEPVAPAAPQQHGVAYDDPAALPARPPLPRSDSTIARAQQFEEYQRAMSQMSQSMASRSSGAPSVPPVLTHQNSAGGLWSRLARGIETESELHQFFVRRQSKVVGAGKELHIGSAVKVVNNAALQAFVSGKTLVKDAIRAHRVADSFLFHGCPQPVAANIQADGLKMSFAASGMLGRGLYGAPDPRKSLQYCKDSTHGKFMFVCRYNLSHAKRAGPDTQHRNTIFDEFSVYDERHVVVLWMIKLA